MFLGGFCWEFYSFLLWNGSGSGRGYVFFFFNACWDVGVVLGTW